MFYIENEILKRKDVDSKGLDGSIEKWQFIVDHYKESDEIITDGGTKTCDLCMEYFWDHDCVGCPIAEYTGQRHCDGTSYPHYYNAYVNDDLEGCKKYAQMELDLLLNIRHSLYGDVEDSGRSGEQNG